MLARLGLLAVLLGAACPQASERPATAAEAAGVPSVAVLESRGASIGQIEVHVLNIFDPGDPREDHGVYRLVNRLHYRTRERTVRDQLLFAPGERLNARKLAETERLLRSAHYLNDAWVVPVRYDDVLNTVDLAVTVRDVWTLNPGISLGRSGGSNRSKFQIEEQNLFGMGTRVAVARSRDVDRASTLFSYFDSHLNSSWWQLRLDYEDNSDGRVKALGLARPFYALDTRNAGGFNAYDGTSRLSRYSGGDAVDVIDEHRVQHQAYYGWSKGLIDGVTERWFAGVRYDEASFAPHAGVPLIEPLPQDRTHAYPWIGWQRVQDHYETGENVDLIWRTEDLYLGRSLYAELGYSMPAFGGVGRSALGRFTAVEGWALGSSQKLFLSSAFDGRLDEGALRNASLNASGRYFARVADRQVFYASLTATATHRPDGYEQLLLGGDSGLRGYPLRYQGGTSSALLTLEHRLYTDWYPFRLVRVGGVAFFDAGRTWGRDFTGAAPLGLLKDVGLGIRIGNNRSALGNVLHIDLAYAIDALPGVKRFQLTIETKERF